MHDIRRIREAPEEFDRRLGLRDIAPVSARLLTLDEENRRLITEKERLLASRNSLSVEVGEAKRRGEDADGIIAEVQRLKEQLETLEEAQRVKAVEITDILSGIPNLPDPSVPYGQGEDDNVVVRQWGEKPTFSFTPQQHFALGEALGQLDFGWSSRLSGARFSTLLGDLARLERALGNFMVDYHLEHHGLKEVSLPVLVNDQTMYNTGQLPKFSEDLYKVADGFWLIPTAEVPLTNYGADRIFSPEELPLRLMAWTQCFRRESGSAGRDTRGIMRVHQFNKVEMVTLSHPDHSMAELERMTECAENILKALGIAYQVVLLCSNDMGPGAVKTYDIETWLPGQGRYREISSCSNCGAYQALRMAGRMKDETGKRAIHTLNGSGLAVGRTLIAVLENYQQADGSIVIPECLRPYMGGLGAIG